MGPVEAEKYEVTGEKRIGAIPQEERILETIKKNPYFVIYIELVRSTPRMGGSPPPSSAHFPIISKAKWLRMIGKKTRAS